MNAPAMSAAKQNMAGTRETTTTHHKESGITMAQNYRVHEMSSKEFHTLALEGWPHEHYGSALVAYTPKLCTFLLNQRYKNRIVSPSDLAKLKRVLMEKRWRVNGETLIYTAAFEPLDGQHRLQAGIETDTPFEAFSIWGVDPTVFPSIDIGKKRSGADHLSTAEIPNYAAMAAALRVLYRIEQKAMRTSNVNLPDDAILPYLDAHPKIKYSVNVADGARTYLLRSVGAALHYSFTQRESILADTFFHDLIHGEGLTRRDPVLPLRDFLSGSERRKKEERHQRGGDAQAKADMAAQTIVAWNAIRQKKTLTVAYLLSVDTRPFPEIV
jgi:hypothetical protein